MRLVAVIIFLLGHGVLHAQKKIVKTIDNTNVSFIQIDSKNCFSLALETVDTSRIIVESVIDGEYLQDVLVNVKQEGTTVLVSSGFHPNFVFPNDKLSAHKVISISLKISIPKNLKVTVYGNSTNVDVRGHYADLKISLSDGSCTLNVRGENVDVHTQSGNIEVIAAHAQILASTKYGKIKREDFDSGDDHFTLNSVTGEIGIRKTE
ncbi:MULTISPECIES: hypothetical protein [unclassified Arenibacter]|jgi:hypothetical protein|uniref:hypothetical protein n=1 Tax=unclassified Arenibacter TaxID=2615047 RepID=UPI000E34BDBF|nr:MULTISPECIES: hypothetical protein [unclassified Arenibacter]MCM4163923.1 hypothetical protein [Arenibacter sp. A80]RFT56629.1 hypothetical protein D0S24_09955 [Arenibacter sp. P308M17]